MFDSYKIGRKFSHSDPIKEMRREKIAQINSLYNLTPDREENTTLNWKPFAMSPRVFDIFYQDSVHTRMTVETIHPDDVFVTGDYLQYDGCEWLCLNSHNFHNMYCRGLFQKCNNELIWQDYETLEIHKRPAIIENATKYGTGQDFGDHIEIPTSSRRIQVGKDSFTVRIDSPMRLMISTEGASPTVYKVTQNDTTTNNYGGKGICAIVCMSSEFNENTDNVELKICDYKDPNRSYKNSNSVVSGMIFGRDDLKLGANKPYYCKFYNEDNLEINYSNYDWEIECDFKDKITTNIVDNKIYISISDKSCLSKYFYIRLVSNGEKLSELKVHVVDVL